MLYLLNSPVLSSFGVYKFIKISPEKARKLIKGGFKSAIGHSATGEILSRILDVPVPVNRIKIRMKKGDRAIVFRLKERLPEGHVITRDEIKKYGFELSLLIKLG